jgi:hypothetical protein
MEWISVNEQLPPDGSPVLVWYVKDLEPAWLMWSSQTVEEMHADFKRLGFTHWLKIEPPPVSVPNDSNTVKTSHEH